MIATLAFYTALGIGAVFYAGYKAGWSARGRSIARAIARGVQG